MVISSFKEHITFLKGEIDKNLKKVPIHETPKYLYDPIRYIISGKGKRLRPILVHLSGQVYDADPSYLMKAGIAVELLHNFTLVHDDIMDEDEMRHAKPTVHQKWDNSVAILSGDGLFVLSQLVMSGLPQSIIQRFNEVSLTICEGQGFDKEFENNPSIQMEEYLMMIGKKTGALLGLCSEIGSLLGGQDIKNAHQLYSFGLNLGLAFQIQDDFLEIYGKESTIGKSLGSDIEKGKQTALTILAREKHPQAWKDFISGNPSNSDYKFFFQSNRIDNEAKKIINHYLEKATEGLALIPKHKRKNLDKFTNMILMRKF